MVAANSEDHLSHKISKQEAAALLSVSLSTVFLTGMSENYDVSLNKFNTELDRIRQRLLPFLVSLQPAEQAAANSNAGAALRPTLMLRGQGCTVYAASQYGITGTPSDIDGRFPAVSKRLGSPGRPGSHEKSSLQEAGPAVLSVAKDCGMPAAIEEYARVLPTGTLCLDLTGLRLRRLPVIQQPYWLQSLALSFNELTEWPQISSPGLKVLNLAHNQLAGAMPADLFARLPNLQVQSLTVPAHTGLYTYIQIVSVVVGTLPYCTVMPLLNLSVLYACGH